MRVWLPLRPAGRTARELSFKLLELPFKRIARPVQMTGNVRITLKPAEDASLHSAAHPSVINLDRKALRNR